MHERFHIFHKSFLAVFAVVSVNFIMTLAIQKVLLEV